MNGSWVRNGALSCAIACGVMIVGPGIAGSAVASAILGIGGGVLDLFGDDDNKRSARHPSVGEVNAAGITGADRPTSTIGVTKVDSGGQPTSTFATEATGLGGGEVPQSGGAARATDLAPSTAPTTREVVIRAEPPAARGDSGPRLAPVPAFVPPVAEVVPPVAEVVPPVAEVVPPEAEGVPPAPPEIVPPVIVPPAIVLPPAPVVVPPAPAGRPEPPASPIPATQQPRANNPLAPPDSFGPSPMPDSFRIGYPEYLRAATVPDLMIVALPGVAGITMLTAAGGALGFRQARGAAQAALLLTPAAARFVQ
jgi:hypothetical protein